MGMTFASCSDYGNELSAEEISYRENFSAIYGDIDPDQDWNMAERGSVTVNTGSSSNIKIYGKNGAGYQLIASYSDVKGTQTLNFDALQGTESVMVSDGMTSQVVPVGGSVNFSGTRTVVTGTSFGSIVVKELPEYRYFTEEQITAYTQVAPEGQDNTKKVTCNYTLTSNGKFVIYPVFWQTSSWSNLGIYFKDADGLVHTIPVYKMKEGDDMQYWNSTHHYDDQQQAVGDWSSFSHTDLNSATYNTGSGDPSHYLVRSKGIEIDIPAGTVFGMYIEVQSNVNNELDADKKWKNYSEAQLNSSAVRTTTSEAGKEYINSQCLDKSLAAFYTVGDYTYFSFEDWNPDNDLNDMVFMFGGNIPTSTDEEAQEWLVACEDLAEASGDNDFNDVVFKVSHGEGYTTANVLPLATGAKYKAEILFGTDENTATKLGEIHDLIVPGTTSNYENGELPFYNTNSSMDERGAGQMLTIKVNADFSMAAYTPEGGNGRSGSSNMGNFMIKSYRSTEDGGESLANIVASEKGTAPTMFCVPATYQISAGVKGVWVWPKERHGISAAYPGFANWVADGTKTDWYKTMNENEVVTGLHFLNVTQGASSDLNKLRPLRVEASEITLEVDDTRTLSVIPGGSDGTISISCGNSDIASATLDGNTITINAVAEGVATVSVMMTASSDGKYTEQNRTIKVNVEAVREASDFAVTPANIEMTTIDGAQTITVTSKNDNKPVIADISGNSITLGEISASTENNGVYTWTFTVNQKAEGRTSFYVTQGSNQTYKAGSRQVTVNVSAPSLGEKLTNLNGTLWSYVAYKINSEKFATATKVTIYAIVKDDKKGNSYQIFTAYNETNTLSDANSGQRTDNWEKELTGDNLENIKNGGLQIAFNNGSDVVDVYLKIE